MDPLLPILCGAGGFLLSYAASIATNARREGAFQEFKEQTTKKINGMPAHIAELTAKQAVSDRINHEMLRRVTALELDVKELRERR